MAKKIYVDLKDAIRYKTQGSLSYFIKFDYDEYFVLTLKQLPKRYYHADSKTWEIPASLKDEVEAWCKQMTGGSEINQDGKKLDITKKLFEGVDTCEADLKSVRLPKLKAKIPLLSHQKDAVKFGMIKGSFLLGDEMGLGKTASAIHYALYMKKTHKYKHCLIITGINGLKWNWMHEIEKHTDEKGWVLGMKQKKRQAHVWAVKNTNDVLEDLRILPKFYFLITNIEKIRDPNVNKKLVRLIADGEIEMIIMDECQAVKSQKAKQTKAFLELRPQTRMAMTGTPMMNNPLELWTVLNWLGVEKHTYWEFRNYYAVFGGYMNKEVVDYKNLGELQRKLGTCMLRRLTKNVIDLPEKIETYEYLEMSDKQWKIYDEIRTEILKQVDLIKKLPNPLVALIRLRQATAFTGLLSSEVNVSAKLDRLEELAEELVANGKKFIVFSNWEKVIMEAEGRLKKYNPALVTGKIQEEHREQELARFKTDDKCSCILGTTSALGTGYTLNEATYCIFLDDPWNMAIKDQAQNRCFRIGQGNTVNIITLVCAGTIDERIAELVYKKGQLSQAILDADLNDKTKIADYVDYLLK